MNEVLKNVSDTVTNEPVVVTVELKPQGRVDSFLKKLRLRPVVRVFKISQITVGNLIRMSGLLTSIDRGVFEKVDNTKYLQASLEGIHKYGHVVAEVIAIAIHNRKEPPPYSLIKFIKTNFTAIELYNVLSVCIRQMDVSVFTNTIISVGRLNILESQAVSVKSANGVSH